MALYVFRFESLRTWFDAGVMNVDAAAVWYWIEPVAPAVTTAAALDTADFRMYTPVESIAAKFEEPAEAYAKTFPDETPKYQVPVAKDARYLTGRSVQLMPSVDR